MQQLSLIFDYISRVEISKKYNTKIKSLTFGSMKESSTRSIFHSVFSTIFSSNRLELQSDQIAEEIYADVIHYIQQPSACIFTDSVQREILIQKLKRGEVRPEAQTDHISQMVKYKCQYGCAIVFKKEDKSSTIKINVVNPEGWKTTARSSQELKLEYSEAKQTKGIHIPEIVLHDMPLKEFVTKFMQAFENVLPDINNIENRSSNNENKQKIPPEFKPSEVERAAKYVIDTGKFHFQRISQNEENKMKQNGSGEKKAQKIKNIGSGLSLKECDTSSSWYVPEAVIKYVIIQKQQMAEVAQKLILGYKMHILHQITSNQNYFEKISGFEISKLKKCLDYIIFFYKEKISIDEEEEEDDRNVFYSTAQQIEINLEKLIGGVMTTKIQDTTLESIKYTISKEKPSIFIPQRPKFIPIQRENALIRHYPLHSIERTPFKYLLDLYKKFQQEELDVSMKDQLKSRKNQWILLVNQTFFSLTSRLIKTKEVFDMGIALKEVVSQTKESILCQLILAYQKEVMKNLKSQKYYGTGNAAETRSHLQLIKIIGSAVAFEVVRDFRSYDQSNLEPYRIPFDLKQNFGRSFFSKCYYARKAMKQLLIYERSNQLKRKIFVLDGTKNSFAEFAKQAAMQTTTAKIWLSNVDRILDLQIDCFLLNITVQEYSANRHEYYTKNGVAPPGIATYRIFPERKYTENDKLIYAFIHSMTTDIRGLVKMFMIAQGTNGKEETQENPFINTNNLFTNQQISLTIYATKINHSQTFLSSTSNYKTKNQIIVNLNQPSNDLRFLNQNCSNAAVFQPFYYHDYSDRPELPSNLTYLLEPPNNSVAREHTHYANLHRKPIKPISKTQMDIEQFLAAGNTRSTHETQLVVLFLRILQRKIIANTYSYDTIFVEEVVLQTAGHFAAYNKSIQQRFHTIQNMLIHFPEIWVYSDVFFCSILGPILGYFARQIVDDQINKSSKQDLKNCSFILAKKCFEELERHQKEVNEHLEENLKWKQRFICMAALCCFREMKIQETDSQIIVFLAKLLLLNRSYQILAHQEIRSENARIYEEQMQFSIQKVVYFNIECIANYLQKHQEQLNDIIRGIDKSAPQGIIWNKINVYQFQGTVEDHSEFYQINLYKGLIFKNGKEITGLEEAIKKDSHYIGIFGQKRQFQVFPRPDNQFLRTSINFNYFFKIKKKVAEIFFEFIEDGSSIRYIWKYPATPTQRSREETWTLLKIDSLKKSKCQFPKTFLYDYYAWYCQERKCIVFRRPQLAKIFEIGIIIHLEDSKINFLKKSYILQEKHYHDALNELLSDKNQRYDEIILRPKSDPLEEIHAYKVLSKFEQKQFIFQIREAKTEKISYYLHRYNTKLNYSHEIQQLRSESFQGYIVDHSFYSNQCSIFNKFQCLVLKKQKDIPMIMNNHNWIVLISEGKIRVGGQIHKSQSSKEEIGLYKYDIHDFYGDGRGFNRESQLHLASLMLSINNGMRIDPIQLTPLHYAMHLTKSCFTNRPLTSHQKIKVKNIIRLAQDINEDSMLLLCQALIKISTRLNQVIFFNEKFQYYFSRQEEAMMKILYEEKLHDGHIPEKQKIPAEFLEFIGGKIQNSQSTAITTNAFAKKKKFWKNIKDFTGSQIEKQISESEKLFKVFEAQCEQINVLFKHDETFVFDVNSLNFPQQIELQAIENPQDLMMSEMVTELKKSYRSHKQHEEKIKRIMARFNQQKIAELDISVKKVIQSAKDILNYINKIIETIKNQNKKHPDSISGIRPIMSISFFTKILCEGDKIKQYLPNVRGQICERIKDLIKIWIKTNVRLASFRRIEVLINAEKLDIVAIMRQITSPRKKIDAKNWWLCFEAQMKIQLWSSQLETYENLMGGGNYRPFCQLNMGQGKTQVIIPMMILDIIFGRKSTLPRINLLSSLFEEARGNFFKFISVTGFQIPGFQLPFDRKVKLLKENIASIKNMINIFSRKAYILMTRESRLSMILRYHEGTLRNKWGVTMEKHPIFEGEIFDIFDEIDAMMSPKRSYIYSIGDTIELPQFNFRVKLLKACLDQFLKNFFQEAFKQKMVAIDEPLADAIQMIKHGGFPPGLRLTLQNADKKLIKTFRRSIAKNIIVNPQIRQFSFIKNLDQKQIEELLHYIVDIGYDETVLSEKIPKTSRDQIYLMRGAFAYGIFEHCLEMRCGVTYGVPNYKHKKKIAVPFQAADIPSQKSEYAHPDVSILLSLLAYYSKGLKKQQFIGALKALLDQSETSKNKYYSFWINSIAKDQRQILDIENANQINFQSHVHKDKLYHAFKHCRQAISFWLNNCIFPIDLRQCPDSITSSAWDLADVNSSAGFSGTRDNYWLFPTQLVWKPCQTPQILGTDGKMIELITTQTIQICLIQEDKNSLWQRFLSLALQKKVGCVIDAGALCVGKSLKNQIVKWLSKHQLFDHQNYSGISFSDETGKWQVYDIKSHCYIARGSSIPDHKTFVIFDEARTRGADLKMDADVVAALSLGPNMTKDKLMQAAGRLRKLGRNQRLIIMGTSQVFSHLPKFTHDQKMILQRLSGTTVECISKAILGWCCRNSIIQNNELLPQFASLGWKHIETKQNKVITKEKNDFSLQVMYKSMIVQSTADVVNKQNISVDLATNDVASEMCRTLQKYGKIVKVITTTLNDICEREVAKEPQKQIYKQDDFIELRCLNETDSPTDLNKLEQCPYKFDHKFSVTSNLFKTTQSSDNVDYLNRKKSSFNQISECYFVKINISQKSSLQLISLRDAALFIKKFLVNKEENKTQEIHLLNHLSLQHDSIINNSLQKAFICAKLYAGDENYNSQEEEYLFEILCDSMRELKWKDHQEQLENVISYSLKRRRVKHKKWNGSTLDEMMIRINNAGNMSNQSQSQIIMVAQN